MAKRHSRATSGDSEPQADKRIRRASRSGMPPSGLPPGGEPRPREQKSRCRSLPVGAADAGRLARLIRRLRVPLAVTPLSQRRLPVTAGQPSMLLLFRATSSYHPHLNPSSIFFYQGLAQQKLTRNSGIRPGHNALDPRDVSPANSFCVTITRHPLISRTKL